MNTLYDNEKRFYDSLADVPLMPDCYKGVARHCRQRKVMFRTIWATAATLVIAASSLLPYRAGTTPVPYQPVAMEATDELQHARTLFSDNNASEETASYSLVNNDLY
jgi:hypothetical protein